MMAETGPMTTKRRRTPPTVLGFILLETIRRKKILRFRNSLSSRILSPIMTELVNLYLKLGSGVYIYERDMEVGKRRREGNGSE